MSRPFLRCDVAGTNFLLHIFFLHRNKSLVIERFTAYGFVSSSVPLDFDDFVDSTRTSGDRRHAFQLRSASVLCCTYYSLIDRIYVLEQET